MLNFLLNGVTKKNETIYQTAQISHLNALVSPISTMDFRHVHDNNEPFVCNPNLAFSNVLLSISLSFLGSFFLTFSPLFGIMTQKALAPSSHRKPKLFSLSLGFPSLSHTHTHAHRDTFFLHFLLLNCRSYAIITFCFAFKPDAVYVRAMDDNTLHDGRQQTIQRNCANKNFTFGNEYPGKTIQTDKNDKVHIDWLNRARTNKKRKTHEMKTNQSHNNTQQQKEKKTFSMQNNPTGT